MYNPKLQIDRNGIPTAMYKFSTLRNLISYLEGAYNISFKNNIFINYESNSGNGVHRLCIVIPWYNKTLKSLEIGTRIKLIRTDTLNEIENFIKDYLTFKRRP